MKGLMEEVCSILWKEHSLEAEVLQVHKTNGVERSGIAVGDGDVRKVYYPSGMEAGAMAAAIAGDFRDSLGIAFSGMEDVVRSPVVYKAVNYERNEGWECECSFRLLDLLFVPFFLVDGGDGRVGMVRVEDDLTRRCGLELDVERIKEDTVRSLVPRVASLREVFGPSVPLDRPDLYCATAGNGAFGVAPVILSGCLSRLAERLGSDLIVLPSSVHELLALPETGGDDLGMLKGVVSEVNRSVVSEEDYLSDSVYRFDRGSGVLEVAI